MQHSYSTSRLSLSHLSLADADFIQELVNTSGWLRFIGNRNVNSREDAEAYIQRILSNSGIQYWVVRLSDTLSPIGLITLIQRDYLPHPDIGFAFLPAHAKQGYAYEAAAPVLADMKAEHPQIFGVTLKENTNSIRLLEKLGLHFSHELEKDEEVLMVYTLNS